MAVADRPPDETQPLISNTAAAAADDAHLEPTAAEPTDTPAETEPAGAEAVPNQQPAPEPDGVEISAPEGVEISAPEGVEITAPEAEEMRATEAEETPAPEGEEVNGFAELGLSPEVVRA